MEGNILISTGTLRKLDSEDELAALLAHELAHLMKKHPSRKNFMRRFPVGVDSYSAIVAAGDRLQQSTAKAKQSDAQLNRKRVAYSQNVSLFWSDILAPSWNRKDEQEADRLGLEMMQAAGYDPRAVVTLIAKLAEAGVQRSQRMQALCDELIAHEQQRRLRTSSDNQLTQAAAQEIDRLRGRGSEELIRKGFDDLLKFSAPYSSNDERIEQVKQQFSAGGGRDMVATKKLKYRRDARDNGELLNHDELAIAGMSALARNDTATGIQTFRQVTTSKLQMRGVAIRRPRARLGTSAEVVASQRASLPDPELTPPFVTESAQRFHVSRADVVYARKAFNRARDACLAQ